MKVQEYVNDCRVEGCLMSLQNMFADARIGPSLAVRTIRSQRIPDIDHRKNPSRKWNLNAF
jgi:hypothetical protein